MLRISLLCVGGAYPYLTFSEKYFFNAKLFLLLEAYVVFAGILHITIHILHQLSVLKYQTLGTRAILLGTKLASLSIENFH